MEQGHRPMVAREICSVNQLLKLIVPRLRLSKMKFWDRLPEISLTSKVTTWRFSNMLTLCNLCVLCASVVSKVHNENHHP